MDWIEDKRYRDVYYKIKKFNTTTYRIEAIIQPNTKTLKTYFAVSSGKKRKSFTNFEADTLIRDGGMQALLWIKNEILNFYSFCNKVYRCEEFEKCFLYIAWSDTRRKRVYGRLVKEGFQFRKDFNENYLVKEIIIN